MAKFVPVGSFDIVIFGVTGDLSKLKLIPALFHRFLDGQIDRASKIIGISRQTLTEEEFLKFAYDACVKSAVKGGRFQKRNGQNSHLCSPILKWMPPNNVKNGPNSKT